MDTSLFEGSPAVSRGYQYLHEAQYDAAAVRIFLTQPTPPLNCGTVISAALSFRGEFFESARLQVGEPPPFAIRPALELGRTRQVESVEEPTYADPYSPLELTFAKRGFEIGDVYPYDVRVQSQAVVLRKQNVATECFAELVNGDVQEVPGSDRVTLGPQVAAQLPATAAAARRPPQENEEGETMTLRNTSRKSPRRARQGDLTKETELVFLPHHAPSILTPPPFASCPDNWLRRTG